MPHRNMFTSKNLAWHLVLFLLLTTVALPAADAATGKILDVLRKENTPGIIVEGRSIRIGDLTILDKSNKKGRDYVITYMNKKICNGDYIEVKPSFPKQEMTTLYVSSFSGGATGCCYDYTIFTVNEANKTILLTHLEQGGRRAEYDEGLFEEDGRIKFGHWYFDGYDANKGDASFSLNHAVAPWLTRFLIYDNGSWRLDKLGEYSDFYKNQLTKLPTLSNQEVDPAEAGQQAVLLAYYGIMARDSKDKITTALAQILGPVNAVLADTVYDDAKASIEKEVFVENRVYSSASPQGKKIGQGPGTTAEATSRVDNTAPGSLTAYDDGKFNNEDKNQDAAQCKQFYEAPCDVPQCLNNRLQFWDKQLNSRFKVLMGNYPEPRRTEFKKEQIAWIKDYMKLQNSLKGKNNSNCAEKTEYLTSIVEFLKQRTLILFRMPSS